MKRRQPIYTICAKEALAEQRAAEAANKGAERTILRAARELEAFAKGLRASSSVMYAGRRQWVEPTDEDDYHDWMQLAHALRAIVKQRAL